MTTNTTKRPADPRDVLKQVNRQLARKRLTLLTTAAALEDETAPPASQGRRHGEETPRTEPGATWEEDAAGAALERFRGG